MIAATAMVSGLTLVHKTPATLKRSAAGSLDLIRCTAIAG